VHAVAERKTALAALTAGLGSLTTKGAGLAMVTDFRGWIGSGIRESSPGAWQRGTKLQTSGDLLTYSPIFACVTRIAADIAKLRPVLMADTSEPGISEPASKASPYWQVLRQPNPNQTWNQFARQWQISKALFGNTYVLKWRDLRGIVTRLYILDPRGVQPLITPDGGVYYSLSSDQLAMIPTGMRACPASEMIHDRGATLWHPLVGIAPLYACALSGTLGLRIQQNSTAFFANMSRPSGMLTAPGTIDPVTAERLKADWNANFSGLNLGKLAVLGDGLEYQAMTIAAEQAQLAEQLGMTAVDVATAYAMPAYKINAGPMPTAGNVEALELQYYAGCLQTHIEDMEACLDMGLGVPEGYHVECDLDGLLRMDSASLMTMLAAGVTGGILSPNEARRRFNLRGVAGGASPVLQQQNFSLAALAKRDARPDPFATGSAAAPGPAPAPAARSIEDLIDTLPPERRAEFKTALTNQWLHGQYPDLR
jgi:HK97 family phage portal protein